MQHYAGQLETAAALVVASLTTGRPTTEHSKPTRELIPPAPTPMTPTPTPTNQRPPHTLIRSASLTNATMLTYRGQLAFKKIQGHSGVRPPPNYGMLALPRPSQARGDGANPLVLQGPFALGQEAGRPPPAGCQGEWRIKSSSGTGALGVQLGAPFFVALGEFVWSW